VRESRACEGCPSSFSWFDGFIFASQTSFRTSIALGTLFVAFFLLRSISKDGALDLHSRVPFLCWERTKLAFVYQDQGMLTSVYILRPIRGQLVLNRSLSNAYQLLIFSLVALEQRVSCR
jgi:hypothetical protein